MCIAIYKPAGKSIDRSTFYNCWCRNSHGAGFAYVKNGSLHIVKGLMTFGEFMNEYKNHKIDKHQSIIHFRYATHGRRDRQNTHPFEITPELALIHNGVISSIDCTERNMSDTWHFARFMKRVVGNSTNAWRDPAIKQDIELEVLYSFNKVAFLHASGDFEIYNRGNWIEDDGILYSNGAFRGSFVGSSDPREHMSDLEYLRKLYNARNASAAIPRKKREALVVAGEDQEVQEISMIELLGYEEDEGSTDENETGALTKAANTLLAEILRNEACTTTYCDMCHKVRATTLVKKYGNNKVCDDCVMELKEQGVHVESIS